AEPHVTIALAGGQGRPLAELETLGHDQIDVRLLVGAERDGLPAEVVAVCEQVAHIPIHSESLNAAMAATVGLYELQRRAEGGHMPAGGAGGRDPIAEATRSPRVQPA
ncbi:MAG TPA: TrmH family RNA methyltransferase, partial [Solirubrobacteraceae bacterium]|nr:TrmH family RNA methyltransferase [Solirubrobacteraceae bacterium]